MLKEPHWLNIKENHLMATIQLKIGGMVGSWSSTTEDLQGFIAHD